MSKLPKIFHNDLKNNISNNKEYVYVSNNILDNSNFDVDRFITSLIVSSTIFPQNIPFCIVKSL